MTKQEREDRDARLAEAANTDLPETDLPETALVASCLFYDIPVGSELSNPSGQLRRIGFRANLSCWIIPKGSMPWTLVHELNKGGANARVVDFDASEGPKLVRFALEQLKKDAADQIKRARNNFKKAAENHLDADEDAGAREEALERYQTRTTAICESLANLLDDTLAAARGFGIDAGYLDLRGSMNAFRSMQVGVEAKASEYHKATQALKEAGTATTTALAAAAEKSQVAPEVMADALREAGNEEAADRLQAAFAAPTPAAPETEDHTYSLGGDDE